MDESEKNWKGTLKQLKRLAEIGVVESSDIGVYYSNLDSVSNMYRLHLENNPMKLFHNERDKAELKKLKKIQLSVKKLHAEISKSGASHDALQIILNALSTFTSNTELIKIGKGKEIKLSKHQLLRIFEMLFDRYSGGAKLSKSFLLANEFLLAAGYSPESKNTKGLHLRKQNFDEAREALNKAGITDKDLFFQIG